MRAWPAILLGLSIVTAACHNRPEHDLILRGGTVYDGRGEEPVVADVAVDGDRIVAVGDLSTHRASRDIDVSGLAVAPGFINMLSWAPFSLFEDPRAMSDLLQGVTLEVFGEGFSMGPLSESMKAELVERQGDIKFDVEWTTLGEYLDDVVDKGVSPNVASFVGATTVRMNVLGQADRDPTTEELAQMQDLVRQAMREGAMGLGSALIYAPGAYAETGELIALARAVAEYGGSYISHIRSEGDRLLEAVDELIQIAREARVPAEIYHLKAAGRKNWDKLEDVIERVEKARREGLRITADMYPYTAGATGLDAAMPPWVQEGGHHAWVERLRDPEIRRRVVREMTTPADDWENLFLAVESPEEIVLIDFKNDALKPLTGESLAEVARMRGTTPAETAIDLVIEDDSRVGTVYFLMSEENVRRGAAQEWVSFCSDAAAPATEGVFLRSGAHPRAYGAFARVLARLVREDKVLELSEAVRRLTSLPATNLGLDDRGLIEPGRFADVVVFDPETIQDNASYADPHHYASGVVHVLVNGVPVVSDGEHTGATPGRVVRGPGWEHPSAGS